MNKVKNLLTGIILAVISLISLIPFWFMFSMSTYKSEKIFQGTPILPSNYFLENLKTIFASDFLKAYGNSLFISIVSMAVSVLWWDME